MSLFQCSKCGCIENTACSRYWFKDQDRGKDAPPLCSACDPKKPLSAKKGSNGSTWHDKFPRTFLPKGEFETDDRGNLRRKKTGESSDAFESDTEYV